MIQKYCKDKNVNSSSMFFQTREATRGRNETECIELEGFTAAYVIKIFLQWQQNKCQKAIKGCLEK